MPSSKLLALLGALTGLTAFAVDAYLPALPELAADLSASSSGVQLTLTALLVGLASGQLVAGSLSDRFGRRPPLLVGLIGFVVTSVGAAVAPSLGVLVALRFLQGFFGAATTVVARAVVRDLYVGAAAARAFARLMLVFGAAPILAPVVGALVLRWTSWRGIFVLLASVAGLLLVLSWTRLPESLPPASRHSGGLRPTLAVYGRLVRDRSFLVPALAGASAFGAMFAYISGSPFVLQELHGLSPQQFAVVFGVNAAVLIALSQVSGRVVSRTGPHPLLVTGTALTASGGALLVVTAVLGLGLAAVLVGFLLVVSAIGLTAPNATALALAQHGAQAGSASALLGLLQFVFGAAAAPLTGLGGADSDLPLALTIAGASALALTAALAAGRSAAAVE